MHRLLLLPPLLTSLMLTNVEEELQDCQTIVFDYLSNFSSNSYEKALHCTETQPTPQNNYFNTILRLNSPYTSSNNVPITPLLEKMIDFHASGNEYASIYFLNTILPSAFPSIKSAIDLPSLKSSHTSSASPISCLTKASALLNLLDNKSPLSLSTSPSLNINLLNPKKSLTSFLSSYTPSHISAKSHLKTPDIAIDKSILRYHEIRASQGDPTSNFVIGQIHHQGHSGYPVNTDRAMSHYQIAEDVIPGSLNNLAQILFKTGKQEDLQKAMALLEKGAEQNDAYSLYNLGVIYIKGLYNIETDIKKGLEYLQKSAKNGHIEAQYFLGIYYLSNKSLDIENKATFYLKEAAFNPNEKLSKTKIDAKLALSRNYIILGSCNEAIRLLNPLVEYQPEIVMIKNRINDALHKGNYKSGLLNLILLSELNVKSAKINAVGLSLIVLKEFEEHKEKIDKSFDKNLMEKIVTSFLKILGDEEKEYWTILGDFFYEKKEYEKAKEWYEKAAKGDEKRSSAILARMLLLGDKVERDLEMASFYAEKHKEESMANMVMNWVVLGVIKIRNFVNFGFLEEEL